ncbi:MAG: hypothetical protein Fur0010_19440 [Bdellovibrio sp.]
MKATILGPAFVNKNGIMIPLIHLNKRHWVASEKTKEAQQNNKKSRTKKSDSKSDK